MPARLQFPREPCREEQWSPQMKVRLQIFLLLVILTVVFLPALSAEPITGDDYNLFARLSALRAWDFQSLLPHGGIYYRPVTILTYRFDKFLWQLNPLAMHLENLLLHAVNAILVFFLARTFLPEGERKSSLLPLAAALLFGLHPLTAESVNWISGRTDPLAALFILLTALSILHYRNHERVLSLGLASIFFLLGIFSKEVSIAFLPGAICLVFAKEFRERSIFTQRQELGKEQVLWGGAWLCAALAGFYFLYTLALNGRPGKLTLTLKIIFSDLWYALFVCLRAFAFYLRKIIWPFPLNFAILEVDPLYELLAIPLLIGCIYLLWKRRPFGALLLTGLFLIIPSFLLAFYQIAWTPYAERYLYLPCAFIIPGLVLSARRMIPPHYIKISSVLLVFLILGAGSATFARSLTWRSNLSLWEDTVEKSPLSAAARNDYGIALYHAGRVMEAKEAFETASKLTSIDYQPRHDINHALVLEELNDLQGAKGLYEKVIQKTKGKSDAAREGLIAIMEKMVAQNEESGRLAELEAELSVLKGQKR